MEISTHCFQCTGYKSTECEKKGYVSDMQEHKPKCYNQSNRLINIQFVAEEE